MTISWWSLVDAAAIRRPDRPMLYDDNTVPMTFASYREAALRVAAGLAAMGVSHGSVVSWQLPPSIEGAVLTSALTRLGAVQNPLVTTLRSAEIAFITAQMGTDVLITPGRWRGFDHGAMARATGLVTVIVDFDDASGGLRLPVGDPLTLPAYVPPASTDTRWVFYTSGTTGEPKGVRHSDATIVSQSDILVEQLKLGEDEVFPVVFPIAHIGGPGILAASLRTGLQLPMVSSFDPATTPQTLARFAPTALGIATPFFHAYLAAQRALGPERLFPHLRMCLAGGAPVPSGLNEQVRTELGGVGIYNGWGLTECPMATYAPREETGDRIAATVGKPGPGVELKVAGSGELLLRGPQRFLGYQDGRLDADALDADGFVRTGDIGHVDDDGWVHVTGRIKEIVIRGAENISTREVEDVLVLDPRIADVAVIGLPDPRTGERCCACVVPAADATIGLDDLAAICRAAGLAAYKIPEQMETVEALPRNAMGKVVKDDLRRLLLGQEQIA
ncbi:MAG TPA: AMP-binding protein [Mycobacteriales bacterium]|jgi:acyl-CoA synthetase (AMP-forming)/AMP-acid ligase II|nr:AMP-binding protein [Mycobacteriales bacterium]